MIDCLQNASTGTGFVLGPISEHSFGIRGRFIGRIRGSGKYYPVKALVPPLLDMNQQAKCYSSFNEVCGWSGMFDIYYILMPDKFHTETFSLTLFVMPAGPTRRYTMTICTFHQAHLARSHLYSE